MPIHPCIGLAAAIDKRPLITVVLYFLYSMPKMVYYQIKIECVGRWPALVDRVLILGIMMTDDKQVVIKINFAGNRIKNTAGKGTKPQMVTEWNIKRIIIASIILILILACGTYFWLGQNGKGSSYNDQTSKEFGKVPVEVKNESVEVIEEKQNEAEKVPAVVEKNNRTVVEVIKEKTDTISGDIQKEIQTKPVNTRKNEQKKVIEQSSDQKLKNNSNGSIGTDGPKKVEAGPVVFPTGLMRAVITSSIWKKEPIDRLTSPIAVKKNRARSVFYFTELKGKKGKTFFHIWRYKGKVKYRKKIKILGNRWRASTSKLMNYSSIGDWSVQLTNDEGKVMNEINFTIVGS